MFALLLCLVCIDDLFAGNSLVYYVNTKRKVQDFKLDETKDKKGQIHLHFGGCEINEGKKADCNGANRDNFIVIDADKEDLSLSFSNKERPIIEKIGKHKEGKKAKRRKNNFNGDLNHEKIKTKDKIYNKKHMEYSKSMDYDSKAKKQKFSSDSIEDFTRRVSIDETSADKNNDNFVSMKRGEFLNMNSGKILSGKTSKENIYMGSRENIIIKTSKEDITLSFSNGKFKMKGKKRNENSKQKGKSKNGYGWHDMQNIRIETKNEKPITLTETKKRGIPRKKAKRKIVVKEIKPMAVRELSSIYNNNNNNRLHNYEDVSDNMELTGKNIKYGNKQNICNNLRKFSKEALNSHNKIREVEGKPQLNHNTILCKVSLRWAKKIAQNDFIAYEKGISAGENIAVSSKCIDPKKIVDIWSEEKKSGINGRKHYAQVVWKASKQFCMVTALSDSGHWYTVARYWPGKSNNFTKYMDNVCQPKPCPFDTNTWQ